MNNYIAEDAGIFDITTVGLNIGHKNGKISFSPKSDITLCGANRVKKIFDDLNLDLNVFKKDGEHVLKGELICCSFGSAEKLHKAWKISQNIFEYQSGIATFMSNMLKKAKEINPNIKISTTRKNYPGAKESMIEAVMCGGGVIHRLGLYDSILIFKEHLEFFENKDELELGFASLKSRFFEKKIAVEVDSFSDAEYFASLGADVLQCEKMSIEELKECMQLKKRFPHILISATGGVNINNVDEYAKSGVDFIVTSAPYHAKPADIKVVIERV